MKWKFKELEDCSKDELIECVNYMQGWIYNLKEPMEFKPFNESEP